MASRGPRIYLGLGIDQARSGDNDSVRFPALIIPRRLRMRRAIRVLGLLLLAADRYWNGVVGAGQLVGSRFLRGGRARGCHRLGLRLASRTRQAHR